MVWVIVVLLVMSVFWTLDLTKTKVLLNFKKSVIIDSNISIVLCIRAGEIPVASTKQDNYSYCTTEMFKTPL